MTQLCQPAACLNPVLCNSAICDVIVGRWLDKKHGLEASLDAMANDPNAALVTYVLDITTSDLRCASAAGHKCK
jgi:hypothetical protein